MKSPAEGRVLLRNVSWGTYERLIEEREENSAPRFFYDRGVMEVVSPSKRHESISEIISSLVEHMALEVNLDFESAGSTTFKNEGMARGFEPDKCFYFGESIELARGKDDIDLDAGDPAPDLVVEVDITSPSISKFPIYASLGVSEVWLHDGGKLSILTLENSEYAEAPESAFLPSVTGEMLTRFVADGLAMERPAWARKVREWVGALRSGE